MPVPFLSFTNGGRLAKPNYQYEKRQKELAKKKKQEEKRLQKQKDGRSDEAPQAPAPETGGTPPGSAEQ